MWSEEILGLLIGVAALVLVAGYLVNVYRHAQRFGWLELPPLARGGVEGRPQPPRPAGVAVRPRVPAQGTR